MPFQGAYIKAKGFRVGYDLLSLVRLLVSVSLKIDYHCAVSRLRLLYLRVVNKIIHANDVVRQSKVC